MSGDWIGQEVGHLQPGRIVLLIHEADAEVWHGSDLVAASGDTPELELKVIILFPTPLFDQYPCLALFLVLAWLKALQALPAESQRDFVRIVQIIVLLEMTLLINRGSNKRGRRLLDA